MRGADPEEKERDERNAGSNERMPAIFAAHGAHLLVAAGAAAQGRPRVTFPVTGWWMDGALTKRSVQLD